MTTATPKPPRPRAPLPAAKLQPATIAAAAAAFAAAEILATVSVGRFFSWGRVEALLFFAFRPWLLLVGAVLAQRFDWRMRYGFYAAALLLAGLSESLFLSGFGAEHPWPEAARGIAAGAILATLFDLVLGLGRRLAGRIGRSAATGALVILLVIPGALRPYELIALGGGAAVSAVKSDLMLMSALPLVWGEKGPLDPASRPAASYKALSKEFAIRLLDVLDERNLASGRLLLVAQPRALAPEELVALDAWVRNGGRALILTDPMLVWPSELPLGDIRRPPAIGLLDPLLGHWGLRLDPPAEPRLLTQDVDIGGRTRRLNMFGAGRFSSSGGGCRVGPTAQIARCRLGQGSAMLLADADMLHDRLWVGPGDAGAERHARLSDNPIGIADWLDALDGSTRQRAAAPVQWLEAGADRPVAWLLALLPLLLAAAPAAIPGLRRRI